MCGGEHFASYRRDRENAGRTIALVARFAHHWNRI
jgi:copper oxidase (laccase) domain-containing protein